ncbi:MAG: elongation factor P [Pleurocapsa minor GSE-CHR-MK-17-07R]|jgi:elongation factor P|nr:elongation factor P [Pleurocapsa minor GSE-CHR-MK 17-07R]
MILAGDLKRGSTLRVDGRLVRVQKAEYGKPGRGTATMTVVMQDIETGSTNKRIFGAEDKLEDIFVEAEPVEFLYRDGDVLHFMNTETYDQYEARIDLFGDDVNYLKEAMNLQLKMYSGRAIDYEFPTTVTYTVVEAEVAVVGNSAGNVTKRVITDSGLSVVVPIFIKEGDKIDVDTRDGSYTGRGSN